KVTVDLSGNIVSAGEVAIGSGNKVVIGGSRDTGKGSDVMAVRLTSKGALDTTFSSDGKRTVDVSPGYADTAGDIAIQADGKIVLAGHAITDAAGDYDLAFVRLLG